MHVQSAMRPESILSSFAWAKLFVAFHNQCVLSLIRLVRGLAKLFYTVVVIIINIIVIAVALHQFFGRSLRRSVRRPVKYFIRETFKRNDD